MTPINSTSAPQRERSHETLGRRPPDCSAAGEGQSSALEKSLLSRDEARSLTDEVKSDAERLWRKVLELRDGGAHIALGYGSWRAYWAAEFGGDGSRGDQLVRAGEVMEALGENFPALPANDAQARELAVLLKEPTVLREAWQEVVAEHPEPTAANVREVVVGRLYRLSLNTDFFRSSDSSESPLKRKIAEKCKARLYQALLGKWGVLEYFDVDKIHVAAAVCSYDELRGMVENAKENARTFLVLAKRIENVMQSRRAAGLLDEGDHDADRRGGS